MHSKHDRSMGRSVGELPNSTGITERRRIDRGSLSTAESAGPDFPANPVNRKTQLWRIAATVGCVALGCFAVALNDRFYQRAEPFYDSMGYHQEIYRTMATSQQQGPWAALKQSIGHNTVFMPQLLATLAAPWMSPSRAVGVWIQVGELLLLTLSLFHYFHSVRGLRPPLAALLLLPIASLHCLYAYNGGLPDFRMDLSLALMFMTTAVWYLIAAATKQPRDYAVCGLAAGVTCLFRGTAPVYLLVALGPVCAFDLLFKADRKARLAGAGAAVLTASVVAGWFFFFNFEHLRYYYLVWNHDALARLPLHESWKHFVFVAEQIGLPALVFVVVLQVVAVRNWLQTPSAAKTGYGLQRAVSAIDWRLLWIGIAPAGFLMAKGAGLNPFVSMPSAFGLALFLLLPMRSSLSGIVNRWSYVGLSAAAVLCLATALKQGWNENAGPATNAMAAHKAVIESIVTDAQGRQISTPQFGVCHLYYLNSQSLLNVLAFDLPSTPGADSLPSYHDVKLTPIPVERANEVEWSQVSGDTDSEKMTTIIRSAEEQLDYLVIPNEATAEFMKKHLPHHPTNRVLPEMRKQLLASGAWQKVSGDFLNRPEEVVAVYRNAKRTAAVNDSKIVR